MVLWVLCYLISMIIYNGKFKERSRELRKAGNLAEVLLWQRLQKRQFLGLLFARQKIIGHYIADFYCHKLNIVVEIDGSSHDDRVEYDKERDDYMAALGLKVFRVFARDVLANLDGVIKWLEKELKPFGAGDAYSQR